jgi:hypothetical protein
MAMRGPFTSGACKIERVLQPTGSIRFDPFCEIDKNDQIIRRLQQFSARWVWHVRLHRPFHVRHPLGNESMTIRTSRIAQRDAMQLNVENDTIPHGDNRDGRLEAPSLATKPLAAMTYNIHGAKKKTADLQHLLHTQKCDAIGLQETLLKSTISGQEINTPTIIGSVHLPVGARQPTCKAPVCRRHRATHRQASRHAFSTSRRLQPRSRSTAVSHNGLARDLPSC